MPHNDKRFDPHRQSVLTTPERFARWNPPEFLARLEIRPGETVLDVGSGPGFWTTPLADLVGPAGRVWALDGSPVLLEALASRHPPAQVRTQRAELPVTGLPDAVADLAWVAFVFHEVEPPQALARELRRVLKSAGRLAILEWRPDARSEQGPPRADRIAVERLETYLRAAGFVRIAQTWQDEDNYLVQAAADE